MLLVELDHRISRSAKFVSAFEGSEFGDEKMTEQIAALLDNELLGRCRRST